ncbi:DUF6509 family protein [Paenibacillus sp. OV219]|uniref:DUF6509 family protein n=1 Tax=Paenibacillus sp. OV219 TaxID=1884377 RepID=UPI0008CEB2F8|nr:DUF6509 family protein [Paenibacillus sp. OV219]SEM88073.1 hypothetical protein SAMN05518847_1011037 [Paenibacillus sp. OV219]
MFTITEFEVNKIKDPFGIVIGDRYEFRLDLDIEEDDELYTESGVYVRVIFRVDGEESSVVKYELHERGSGNYLDFDLEEEEEQFIESFCKENFSKWNQ